MEHYTPPLSFMRENVLKKAEAMQKSLHLFVEQTVNDNPKISYQDATVTFLILKLAELQEEIRIMTVNL